MVSALPPPATGWGRRWSLALGVLAFAIVAPPSLVGLPFAALVVAARPATPGEWLAAALAGGLSTALLLTPETGVLDGLTRAWIVLVSVAFAGHATVRPVGFWPLALRACLYAAAGVAVLGAVVGAGPTLWGEVRWEATRGASGAARRVVEIAPPLYPAFEPTVRLVAVGWPLWLLLETLAGLALAWRGHALVARNPFGSGLAASRARPAEPAGHGTPGTTTAGAILNH